MSYRQLIAIAFLFNGFSGVGAKAVGIYGLERETPLFLVFMYAVGAAVALIYVLRQRKPIGRRGVIIGLMAAGSSVLGTGSLLLATGSVPAYILFPLTGGGSLLLVALIGRIFFRETIGPYGIAGILTGIAGIVLLSIK